MVFLVIGSLTLLIVVYYLGLEEGERNKRMAEMEAMVDDREDDRWPTKRPLFMLEHVE